MILCGRQVGHPRRRAAFTLLEMLVVILIIIVLSGLALGGWGALRTSQRKQTTSLRIEQLTHAISTCAEEGVLPASGFEDNLIQHLVTDPVAAGKAPYIETTTKTVDAASQFIDAWGAPLLFERGSLTAPVPGWAYGSQSGRSYLNGTASTPLLIRSTSGTDDGISRRDDVIWAYTNLGGWNRVQ